MSPTALRWLAVPLGLVALAANLVRASWFDPLTYEMSFGWGTAAWAAGILVALGVPLCVFLALGYWRPTRFERVAGGLVAPADPAWAGLAIVWMGMAGEHMVDRGHLSARIGAVVFDAAVATAFLVIQRPRLELDPTGLTIRRIRTAQRIAWDQLAPGWPVPPERKRPQELRVYLNEPPAPAVFPPGVSIPANRLHIDSAYLAETLRHYVEHPEARGEIGLSTAEPVR